MTDKQKFILAGGAAAAFLILRSKKAGANPLSSLLKKPTVKTGTPATKLPVRGTNTPYLATTNMASRGGVVGAPRVPTSGLGYGTTARGVAQGPTSVGAAAIQAGGGTIASLFNYLARRSSSNVPTAANTKPAPSTSTQKPQSGGSSEQRLGPQSGSGRPNLGGAAGVAGQTYSNGYFDGNGQWVGYSGYYDASGNFVQLNEDGTLPGLDSGSGGGLQATVPNLTGQDFSEYYTDTPSGAVDENGAYDETADSAVEVLPSYDTVGYSDQVGVLPIDSSVNVFPVGQLVDPVGQDSQDMFSGSADDSQFATVDDGSNYDANFYQGGGTDDAGGSYADDGSYY